MVQNIVTKETLKHAMQNTGGGNKFYRHHFRFYSDTTRYYIVISTRSTNYTQCSQLIDDLQGNTGVVAAMYVEVQANMAVRSVVFDMTVASGERFLGVASYYGGKFTDLYSQSEGARILNDTVTEI